MTAHAMKGDKERCLAAGMDGYLAKPIHANTLYETVEAIAPAEKRSVKPMSKDAVLDWDAALRRVGGRADLLKNVVKLFYKKENDKLIKEIRQAVSAGDAPRLRRVAHSLKGSADCFAAQPAVSAALRLELMGQRNELAGADQACADLEREVERLKLAPRRLHCSSER